MKIYKKWWFWLIIILVLVVLIIFSNPGIIINPYGGSCGDEVCFPVNRICDCSGIMIDKELPWHSVEHYCIGSVNNCKCYNEAKATELSKNHPEGFKNLNKKYNTYQELLDSAYDPC
ncbi:MAG: hypothetical protein Q7S74_03150 [Nanoarchaeota archaeon]|nr:hypothetical protein [Nanoarchaeota archaeon]